MYAAFVSSWKDYSVTLTEQEVSCATTLAKRRIANH
jgi:hypothetical protein